MKVRVSLSLLLALALGSGCGANRDAAWDDTTTPTETSDESVSRSTDLRAQADEAWAGRDEEANVARAIELYAQAAEANPNDPDGWVQLSRARYFMSDCHLRFDEERQEQFMTTFEEGTSAAERALVALSDEFTARMRDGDDIEEAAQVLDARAVPALYWRSSNLGKWATEEGFATLLSYKNEIRDIMQLCLDLDQSYYYYGPDRYFGVVYAKAPAFAGGDVNLSREHFETSLRHEPNYFATRVLMAADYAVKAQEREVFETQLNWVLSHDPELIPEVAPENRCEQRKARLLLAEADDLFE